MKPKTDKIDKKRHRVDVRTAKPVCGTLSYMSECRGITQKDVTNRWAAPPDSIDKIVRK